MGRATMRLMRHVAVLPLVALVLFVSAAARIASGAGSAIAREVVSMAPAHAGTGADPGASAGHDAAEDGAGCPVDPEIAPILSRLNIREVHVSAAETRIAEKQKALAAAERRMSERLGELKAAEDSLASTMARSSSAAEDDLAQLTAVYETMKPKDAVPLFEAMDPEFAAGFLARMRPDAAAAVMAKMNPDFVYAISAILAGRNARAPRD